MAKFIEGVKSAGVWVLMFVGAPFLAWAMWRNICAMFKEEDKLRAEIARLEGRA